MVPAKYQPRISGSDKAEITDGGGNGWIGIPSEKGPDLAKKIASLVGDTAVPWHRSGPGRTVRTSWLD